MRLILGFMTASVLVVGTSMLAWHGLELSRDLAPEMEYWAASEKSTDWSSTVDEETETDAKPTAKVRHEPRPAPVRTTARITPTLILPGSGGIAVPDNARAGSRSSPHSTGSTTSSRTSSRDVSRSTSGRTYGLDSRSQLSKSLDYRWYAKPKFPFTAEGRKKNASSNRVVRNASR